MAQDSNQYQNCCLVEIIISTETLLVYTERKSQNV